MMRELLISAIQDPNPILFFEHKALYRSQRQVRFDFKYSFPIGFLSWPI